MSTSKTNIGDRQKITCVFTPETGNTVAAEVTLVIKPPTGASVTYNNGDITQVTTDSYRYDYLCTQSGIHHYRWVSSGTVDAAEEGFFTVQRSQVLGV